MRGSHGSEARQLHAGDAAPNFTTGLAELTTATAENEVYGRKAAAWESANKGDCRQSGLMAVSAYQRSSQARTGGTMETATCARRLRMSGDPAWKRQLGNDQA